MALPLRGLAESIARAEMPEARRRFVDALAAKGVTPTEDAVELAVVLECAYPALAHVVAARPEDVVAIVRGVKLARDARTYRRMALPLVGDLSDADAVRRGLRVFAAREKLRIAARELMPHAGSDVDVTSRELSDLAEVCIDIALAEAMTWAEARYGKPLRADGSRCPFVVLGMGKLGGHELNAGSDVDLLMFYDTDDGEVRKDGKAAEPSLHEFFARVSQRFTATLDDVTEDGMVWRVDLRLRPEGSRGPIVNSLAAAERYYETWGRTWERAALVRARPVGGDIAFGVEVLGALGPFVWRREVNPNLADEMIALVVRARTELASEPERDLKLGVGGIREAEFFVQSLQLIWGGREPTVRSTNTLDALRRLRARGLVTDREGRELADAYLVLRRLEHRVQFATGLQTHTLPSRTDGTLLDRIARTLGFPAGAELERDLDKTRRRVAARLASLSRQGRDAAREAAAPGALERLYIAVDSGDEAQVHAWLPNVFGPGASPDMARHVLALARRPDYPLGTSTRDRFPELGPVLIEALSDAADPEQATRLLAAFFARLSTPSLYAKALAEDSRATRRIAGLFGASAFLGESMVGYPELVDRLLFNRSTPTEESARRAVEEEISSLVDHDSEEVVGALRRAKRRVTMEVGLADLAGELGTRGCTLALSALADATLDHATRFALHERGLQDGAGLAVVAMGKLGGREIGYGSDLDIFFVYDDAAGGSEDGAERFVRTAQRVLRLVSAPHGDGPGYELDTRLRPSGNQGLLIVSLDAFARYHGVGGE
jgi:glutamate-ammonia-ligase adenylyltransferase